MVKGIEIPQPPLDLQMSFQTALDRIDSDLVRARAQLEQLDILFASLQQGAFRSEL